MTLKASAICPNSAIQSAIYHRLEVIVAASAVYAQIGISCTPRLAADWFLIAGMAFGGFQRAFNKSLVLGLVLALLSAALGLQLLAKDKEPTSKHGHQAFATLA